jgi:hypothetical protein
LSVAAPTAVAINMESDCPRDGCHIIAQNLYDVLGTGKYDLCSVLTIPTTLDVWLEGHRTARKRAARAARLGYRFAFVKRHEHADDIYAINTSLPVRQGRPMSAGYHQRPTETPLPAYACDRHAIRTYGVLAGTTLVAYLWLYRAGELGLVSSILGHADHLGEGIMYLLFAGMLEQEIGYGQGAVVYNRHDSGTDGLRFYKERVGLEGRQVEWCL